MKRSSTSLIHSPFVWGAVLTVLFYAPIQFNFLFESAAAKRYFAGSWITYVQTLCFFTGLWFLMSKRKDASRQIGQSEMNLLPESGEHGYTLEDVPSLVALVQNKNDIDATDSLPRRITDALTAILRRGNSEKMHEELSRLSDLETKRSAKTFAFSRKIVATIMMLGFIGTAIGASGAVKMLAGPSTAETSTAFSNSLAMAFDTAVVGLGFSLILILARHGAEKRETELLEVVDARAADELYECFPPQSATDDPLQLSVQRMIDALVPAYDRLLKRQIDLWQATVDEAHEHWLQLSQTTGAQMETAIAGAIDKGMEKHVDRLALIDEQHGEQQAKCFGAFEEGLDRVTDKMTNQLYEITRQGEVITRVIEGNGQVIRLEESLNQNLQTLAGTQQLQETLVSLSATLQLLAARVGALPTNETPVIELPRTRKPRGRAA